MHRPGFAMKLLAVMGGLVGGSVYKKDDEVPGSDHERRLLRRKNARKVGAGYADPYPVAPVGC